MMSTASSYDTTLYISAPVALSHPDRLAAVAALFGVEPPALEGCRVLELGCATGGNVIPMAESMPDSSFLGIDLSERQIAEAQKTVADLGLQNLKLRRLNIADIDPGLGQFDYIVCHGVFSWVEQPIQERILSVCKQNLAPDGIAYVSYNTMPGWHLRGMIRDMMVYHTRQLNAPPERAEQARALLDFLAKSVHDERDPYGLFLKSELDYVQQHPDFYILHDHLEDHNEPVYFYQFIERAQAKGLEFLAEAQVHLMVPGHFPPGVAATLQRLSADLLHLEQYMDFLRNRTFRETLLCHPGRQPCYRIRPEVLNRFHVASPLRATIPPSEVLAQDATVRFDGPKGLSIRTQTPIVKAALGVLGETWPRALPFPELCTLARERLRGVADDPAAVAQDAAILAKALLHYHTTASSGLVDLRLRPLNVVSRAGERPAARPLARWQASHGRWVTNLFHETVALGELERQILLRLDGQHDRPKLVQALSDLIARQKLALQRDGRPIQDERQIREHLSATVEQQLPKFAQTALLMG